MVLDYSLGITAYKAVIGIQVGYCISDIISTDSVMKDLGVTREPPAAQGGDPGLTSVQGWESRQRLQR